MKYSIFLLLAVAMLASCKSKNEEFNTNLIHNPATMRKDADVPPQPAITFDSLHVNLGTILQGDTVLRNFHFRNTGKAPLLISQVTGSCGCTVPRSYPTDPIAPGDGGDIKVSFDSSGKWGKQTVVISVVTNTVPSTSLIELKVNIIAPNSNKS